MAQIALERPARLPLELFKPSPQLRGLPLGHDADRKDAALLSILFDLGRCQRFRHRSSQYRRRVREADHYHSPARATTVNPSAAPQQTLTGPEGSSMVLPLPASLATDS